MKKILIIILSASLFIFASIVPVERAKKVAENYYKNYAPTAQKGNVITRTIAKKYEGEVTYYAFEFGNQNGFVIVTADDGLRTILGWSFDSGLCSEEDFYNMRNPFANRMSWTDREIIQARKDKFVDAQAQKDWKDMENNIFPSSTKAIVVPALVQTRWGQGYPYNVACPLDGGQPTMNGCVALAMAQVMRYHQGPSNPMGSHSYFWEGEYDSLTLSINYTNSTYDYSLMPTTTEAINTSAESTEVSELCYEAGVSVDMDYGTFESGGSGAYLIDIVDAFKTHFNSWSDIFYVSVGTVTDETTQSANINSDLDNSIPVIWAGSGPDGGHCFILDGRTDDYNYHFNWGWEGSMDGWYKLNNLNPGTEFTSSQQAVFKIRVDSPPPVTWPSPRDFSGFVTNSEDAVLTWKIPYEYHNSVLTGYKLFRNDKVIAVLDSSARIYTDSALCQGSYLYYASATFTNPEGESHISQSKTIVITENNDFPAPVNVNAVVIGRTGIDLSWYKPYIGTIYLSDGFEKGSLSEWTLKKSKLFIQSADWWADDTGDRWFIEDGSQLGSTEYIHSGSYAAAIGYSAGYESSHPMSWLCSPAFEIEHTGATLSFYRWYYSDTVYPPTQLYVKLYWGTFAETKGSDVLSNSESVDFYDTTAESGPHAYDFKTYNTAHTGAETMVCFIFNYSDGYQTAVDDIVIGYGSKYAGSKGSVEPTDYQIFRNGSLAATVHRTGLEESWTDTGFTDGTNDYFVRCLYPAGISIPSNRASAFIDANPAPGFLTGKLSTNQQDIDLDWYAPCHLPPGWFGYTGDEPDSYFDYLDKTEYPGTWKKKRTQFYGSELGLYYPIRVDSIAAAFYEDASEPWVDSIFTFKVYTRNTADTADSLLYGPSGNLEAESGYFTVIHLPTQLVMNKPWWVEIEVRDETNSSQPGVFSSVGSKGFSSAYYTPVGSELAAGWYTISNGTKPYEWWIISYCTGTEPVIAKDGSINGNNERVFVLGPQDAILAAEKLKPVNNLTLTSKRNVNSKGLLGYHIFREGEMVGTTTETLWTDSLVKKEYGDLSYYVTAFYNNPAGESAPSNEITILILGIEDNIPYGTDLSQNYPNPFNPETNIKFSIANNTVVKLKIYNSAGQLVAFPVNKFMNKGSYNVVLNASKLSGGFYIYKLEADGKEFTKKLTIIK
ncbi:MAG TPA: C10 family peptidase [Clostridiales bacterium]|nr:C10 family peptidase [Clostridiales bacterium]HQP70999.1 C10 family peptidase [Clostridiales bacterium]